LSLWLFYWTDSLLIIGAVSVVRLSPLFLWTRRGWPIVFATPYPYSLVFTAYAQRSEWMPPSLSMYLSNPTAFLIAVSGALLAFVLVTGWIVAHTARAGMSEQLRSLAMWLFGLTAAAVLASVPQISITILQYLAEPVAIAGYAALYGWGLRDGATWRASR
jgi:hypothetical protein